MEYQSRNQIRFLLSSGDMLVFDTLVNQWSTYTATDWTASFLRDSVIWNNSHHFLDNTGMVHGETTSYTDNNVYIPLLVETSWIKLADLQGFQRIDRLALIGHWRDPHNLTVDVFVDYVEGANPSYTKVIGAGTSFAPYQTRWKPSRGYAKCMAFKMNIVDSVAAAGGTNQGYSLSGLAIDYKVKKGMYKNTPRTL